RGPARSTLFPSPTLFRSPEEGVGVADVLLAHQQVVGALAVQHGDAAQLAGEALRVVAVRDDDPHRGLGALQRVGDLHRDAGRAEDRKSTRLNSSHVKISY